MEGEGKKGGREEGTITSVLHEPPWERRKKTTHLPDSPGGWPEKKRRGGGRGHVL